MADIKNEKPVCDGDNAEQSDPDEEPVFGRQTIKRQSEALASAMTEGGLEIQGNAIQSKKPPKHLPPLTKEDF